MTHHQLVKEWKEKFQELNFGYVSQQNEDFLGEAMLAAAEGATEAGRVEKQYTKSGTSERAMIFNDAISQSERQLDQYFKGV